MTPLLTIVGFVILLWLAGRLASVKRDLQMGFRPPKKSIWQKLFGK
jgi:hypothetical protein